MMSFKEEATAEETTNILLGGSCALQTCDIQAYIAQCTVLQGTAQQERGRRTVKRNSKNFGNEMIMDKKEEETANN